MHRELLLKKVGDAWIFLNHIPELGTIRFHRLLRAARSALRILELSPSALMAADVSRDLAQSWYRAFSDPKQEQWWLEEKKRLEAGLYGVSTELDPDYPDRLRQLLDRPPVLYYKGKWPPPTEKAIGIVGTRQPTAYGRLMTERLATELSHQGMAVISGLARGIDTVAHQTALKQQAWTVAVLGCGLGQTHPHENTDLQKRIATEGTVVSEFSYEVVPDARNFPRRNRIISGLSDGVVVVQAGPRSGALITARYAAEQGKDVFAVPGQVFDEVSLGCHRLLKQGAKLVESSADILEELYGQLELRPIVGIDLPASHFDKLTSSEKRIVDLLSEQPLSPDELTQRTSQRFERIATDLLSLELKGIVRRLAGERYART
jgi:DNA processing protein